MLSAIELEQALHPHHTAMVSPGSEAAAGNLAELSQQTLETFREFLVTCSRASNVKQDADLAKLLDEYGRLKIWVEQTGSGLRERGSLDESLKDDPDLRDAVASTLQQLKIQIEIGRPTCPYKIYAMWPPK